MGQASIRINAIAPGPFPNEGAWSRLMLQNNRRDLQGIASHEALWPARRTHQPGGISVSDMDEYINGECVVMTAATGCAAQANSTISAPLTLPGRRWRPRSKIVAAHFDRERRLIHRLRYCGTALARSRNAQHELAKARFSCQSAKPRWIGLSYP